MKIEGPKANVPTTGGPGELPYVASAPPAWRGRLAVAAVVGLLGAGAVVFAVAGDSSGTTSTGQEQATPSTAGAATSTSTSTTTSTTTEVPSTTAPTTTTAPPRTTTTLPPATANIPVADLPPHEAVYRDGKLVLQGTVPTAEIRAKFQAQAAAVIGEDNVIVRYQIDPRVPVPTDGRVRVDEDFLFPTGSAAIDDRYKPLMDLGVVVLNLNPQARMRVNGYTDDVGPPDVNLALSQARADALKGYLVAQGIAAGRIDAIGRGATGFVAPNDSDANRSQNRRIEVDLVDLLK